MRADRPHSPIRLLEQDGTLAALIETIVHPDHLWIENLAVAPAHQGRGLGQRLLRHTEDLAWSLKPVIKLQTNRAFEENVGFDERPGFAVEREEVIRGGATVYLDKAL